MWATHWQKKKSRSGNTKIWKICGRDRKSLACLWCCSAAFNFHENWSGTGNSMKCCRLLGKSVFSFCPVNRQPKASLCCAGNGNSEAEKRFSWNLEENSRNFAQISTASTPYQFLLVLPSSFSCFSLCWKYNFTIHQHAMAFFVQHNIEKFQFSNFFLHCVVPFRICRYMKSHNVDWIRFSICQYHIIFNFLCHPASTSSPYQSTQCRCWNQFRFEF